MKKDKINKLQEIKDLINRREKDYEQIYKVFENLYGKSLYRPEKWHLDEIYYHELEAIMKDREKSYAEYEKINKEILAKLKEKKSEFKNRPNYGRAMC